MNVGLLSRVAALFHKERKVRMAPQQWAEVECLTGLQEQGENSLIASGGEGDRFSEASIMQCILDLGQMVRSLLQETMQAFASRDTEAAHRLWEEDKVVERGAYMVRRGVMAMLEGAHAMPALQHDPYLLQRATCLLWITDELERVAGYCTNICERIVFIVQGEIDIYAPLEQ